jgi:aminoglycoside phosphotransferase (APT) family kinase protein
MQNGDFGELRNKLARFLEERTGGRVEVGGLERYPVGFSWQTFGFNAAWDEAGKRVDRSLILRMGPKYGVLAPYLAHDQFIALKALEGSGVPIPKVYWYCDDPAVLGMVFFIMDRVEGEAALPWTESGGKGAFDESIRPQLAEDFVGGLAALHNFAWDGTPAAELRGAAPLDEVGIRQILWWEEYLHVRQLQSYPILEHGMLWMKAHAPKAPRVSIIHGDYRIGNFLVQGARISAMLDWELVHLGDPHEDLGWMCMRPWSGRSPLMCHLIAREDLYRRYGELTGIRVDPEAVRFYEIFGNFKLAAIHVGSERSFEDGSRDLRMATMSFQTPRMLLQLERSLEGEL